MPQVGNQMSSSQNRLATVKNVQVAKRKKRETRALRQGALAYLKARTQSHSLNHHHLILTVKLPKRDIAVFPLYRMSKCGDFMMPSLTKRIQVLSSLETRNAYDNRAYTAIERRSNQRCAKTSTLAPLRKVPDIIVL